MGTQEKKESESESENESESKERERHRGEGHMKTQAEIGDFAAGSQGKPGAT